MAEELVTYILHRGQQLTPEQKERLDALSKMPDDEIVFDEDCPELTDEQLIRATRLYDRLNAKVRKTA